MNVFSQDVAGLSKALDLRAYRHQVLASNIANADTPNYKARDFDFRSSYANAMAGQMSGGLALATTSGAHIGGGNGGGLPATQYRSETQSAADGNTVDMDTERAQMTDNAMQYEILTKLITDRFQGMRSALGSNQG